MMTMNIGVKGPEKGEWPWVVYKIYTIGDKKYDKDVASFKMRENAVEYGQELNQKFEDIMKCFGG